MSTQYSRYFNEEMETLSGDALHDLHQKKFLRQVEYIYTHSPLYHEKFQKAGIQPKDIMSLEDIVKLPFTQKHELREAQMSSRLPVGTAPAQRSSYRVYIPPAGQPVFPHISALLPMISIRYKQRPLPEFVGREE